MISDNLQAVFSKIRFAAERAGRDPSGIVLVGVTKFASLEAVNEAVAAVLIFNRHMKFHLHCKSN